MPYRKVDGVVTSLLATQLFLPCRDLGRAPQQDAILAEIHGAVGVGPPRYWLQRIVLGIASSHMLLVSLV